MHREGPVACELQLKRDQLVGKAEAGKAKVQVQPELSIERRKRRKKGDRQVSYRKQLGKTVSRRREHPGAALH